MEILTYATAWMNPEDIVLSEISQSWKDKHCIILHEVHKVVKCIRTESEGSGNDEFRCELYTMHSEYGGGWTNSVI